MNVAYLTYQYDSNPRGIPSGWVSQVVELGDDDTSPGDNWVVTDIDTYIAYVASVQSAYDAWAVAHPELGPQVTAENYEMHTYNSKGQITSTAWYSTKISDGVYSGKARDIVYTLNTAGNAILTSVETIYDINGAALSSTTHSYLSSTTQIIIEKGAS